MRDEDGRYGSPRVGTAFERVAREGDAPGTRGRRASSVERFVCCLHLFAANLFKKSDDASFTPAAAERPKDPNKTYSQNRYAPLNVTRRGRFFLGRARSRGHGRTPLPACA